MNRAKFNDARIINISAAPFASCQPILKLTARLPVLQASRDGCLFSCASEGGFKACRVLIDASVPIKGNIKDGDLPAALHAKGTQDQHSSKPWSKKEK